MPPEPTTLAAESEPLSRRLGGDAAVHAFVVAWCAHEPQRVGEVAIVPANGPTQALGRGESGGPEPRLRFFRQRAGSIALTPPLASAELSRRQLLLRGTDGRVEVERVGNAAMRVNGQRTDRAVVQAGDVVSFRRELVLLCLSRPAIVPPLRPSVTYPIGAFGDADGCGILGESPAVWHLRDAVAFAAAADVHVLILGETGTGKELAAAAVHRLSSRSRGAFVARNAATLPPTLIDAEIFGNAHNYPNAGMPERRGLVGEAHAGTLFLDEIGELPAELQSHLLRVLDAKGEYQRLGDPAAQRSDFRLVAATNRDPTALKHDFLSRLALRVHVPALRERREDVPLLARQLVLRAAKKSPAVAGRFVARVGDHEHARLSPALVEDLLRREYAGNVRELEAVLWRAMAASEGEVVDLPEEDEEVRPASGGTRQPPAVPAVDPTPEAIRAALQGAIGSVTQAARALGLTSRYALYRLMKKHGIEVAED
jgi:two-component system nitrogen regulation response regulator GlnG/two-component system response regulator HydG